MAQHDYIIADQSGASFLDDLNDMAAATVSTNSGATEPATKYAYMLWADTTAGILKQRNSLNTAWISLLNLATGAAVTATAAAGAFPATANGQTSYANAGLQSISTSGDVLIALHASGATAAALKHTRGGSGVAIIDHAGATAPVTASVFNGAGTGLTGTAASLTAGNATNAASATSATDIANFVAFHAYKSTYQQSGSTVIFDTVLAQKGTAYNATTGVFTVPVAGWYQFSASPQITGDAAWHSNIGFYLAIDGVICTGYYITMPASAMYEGYCISATVYLTAGQQVEVKPNWTLSTSLYVSGGRASSFSGHYLGTGT